MNLRNEAKSELYSCTFDLLLDRMYLELTGSLCGRDHGKDLVTILSRDIENFVLDDTPRLMSEFATRWTREHTHDCTLFSHEKHNALIMDGNMKVRAVFLGYEHEAPGGGRLMDYVLKYRRAIKTGFRYTQVRCVELYILAHTCFT